MQGRVRARAPAVGRRARHSQPKPGVRQTRMRLGSKRPDVQRVLDLQRDAGNRAVQQLVGPFAVQRSCDCGGTCTRCSAADEQSSANGEVLSRLVIGVQRDPLDSGVAAPLIVADGTAASSGQMTRTQFLTTLRQRVTATAQTAFVGSDWTAQDCPALGRWFGYYASKDAAHIERALRSYAPGGATGATAESYIDAACRRVAISVGAFVLTGKIVGLPAEIAGQDLSDGGDPAALASGGGTPAAGVQRAEAGEALPVQGAHIARAMGVDPAGVRVHTDHRAARHADRLDARAFTVGQRISFAAGAFRPGTIEGDALIAHELAHVAQQSDGGRPPAVARKSASGDGGGAEFEAEADRSAFAAVTHMWGRARDSASGILSDAMPRLRSGVRLQRCRSGPSGPPASDFLIEGAQPSPDPHMLMFERNAETLDGGHETKIKTTASAEKTNPLAIYGSASEDEKSPVALAEKRMKVVDAKLAAEGHTAGRTLTNKAADAVGTLNYRSVRRVETQVGSVAVPVPPAAQEDCSASVAKPCTAANTASLNAAVAAGTPMLTTAITKLGTPDAATKDLVRRLFLGGNAAATDAQVVAKATAVQAKLVDWKTHLGTVMGATNHRCVKSCDPICDQAEAYNQGTGGAALKSFCASYFAKTPAEQAVTMVHECGHGTPSVASKDIAYGPMRRLDTLTEAEAMKNTDSYVVLMRNLVAPGSAQIGGSDTFAGGMTNAEESMARRALSWTETWLNACDQLVGEAYTGASEAAKAPGGWEDPATAPWGQRMFNLVSLTFPGINKPVKGVQPSLEDRTRVAAIFDRYAQMITALFGESIKVEKIAGGTPGWDAGPGTTVRVDSTFFTLSDKGRLEWLLLHIALATPGVSATIAPHYVQGADILRQVRSLGSP